MACVGQVLRYMQYFMQLPSMINLYEVSLSVFLWREQSFFKVNVPNTRNDAFVSFIQKTDSSSPDVPLRVLMNEPMIYMSQLYHQLVVQDQEGYRLSQELGTIELENTEYQSLMELMKEMNNIQRTIRNIKQTLMNAVWRGDRQERQLQNSEKNASAKSMTSKENSGSESSKRAWKSEKGAAQRVQTSVFKKALQTQIDNQVNDKHSVQREKGVLMRQILQDVLYKIGRNAIKEYGSL